jgi:hypothetical protein
MFRRFFALTLLLAAQALSAAPPAQAACHAGDVPMRNGGCMPRGFVECGDVYCRPGQACVAGICQGGQALGQFCPRFGLRCPTGELCNPYGGRGCYNPRTHISCGTHNCRIGRKCGPNYTCIVSGPSKPTTKGAADRPPPRVPPRTAVAAPGDQEPQEINTNEEGMRHALEGHAEMVNPGITGKSKFTGRVNLRELIRLGTSAPRTRQPNGNYARTFDAGKIVGADRVTGQGTSTVTIITRPNGDLVTMFPGSP